MGSSPISGTREPQSISFSLLASFLAKRAPYREPDSARPRVFLSLLPPASNLDGPMHPELQCSSLSHSSSPTRPLRLLAPWCRPPRAPYEELHSDGAEARGRAKRAGRFSLALPGETHTHPRRGVSCPVISTNKARRVEKPTCPAKTCYTLGYNPLCQSSYAVALIAHLGRVGDVVRTPARLRQLPARAADAGPALPPPKTAVRVATLADRSGCSAQPGKNVAPAVRELGATGAAISAGSDAPTVSRCERACSPAPGPACVPQAQAQACDRVCDQRPRPPPSREPQEPARARKSAHIRSERRKKCLLTARNLPVADIAAVAVLA